MNPSFILESSIKQLSDYAKSSNLKALVLGISGGIDSTVCAYICREAAKDAGIKFIGRSLTISNKKEEYTTASMVGKSFCDDFEEVNLQDAFSHLQMAINVPEMGHNETVYDETRRKELHNSIALGNMQARLRMIYLYHLAGVNKGMVIDTLNRSERFLGFWTICGDVGDYAPLFNLYKTEVYALARYILNVECKKEKEKLAFSTSIGLTPTDGLGISNSDLEQLGANNYGEVDMIFRNYFAWCRQQTDNWKTLETTRTKVDQFLAECVDIFESDCIPSKETYHNILNRYVNSEFKRSPMPTGRITR